MQCATLVQCPQEDAAQCQDKRSARGMGGVPSHASKAACALSCRSAPLLAGRRAAS